MNTTKNITGKASSKIVAILVVLALILPIFATSPLSVYAAQAAVGDNIVRVYLNHYGEPASINMNAAGSYKIQDNDKNLSGAFTLAASGSSGIKLTNGSASYDLDGDIYLKSGSFDPKNNIQVSGSYKYVGDMRILNKSGKLKIINHVDIETYIMGVLFYEMSNSWPADALKAQAIAARTYTYYVMHSKVRTSVEHDVTNTSQTYYGYNGNYSNCIDAVKATKNQIMKTPDGQVVYACYSASNGGTTENGVASGAAATNFAYLPVKDDPYDLKFSLSGSAYSAKVTIPKTITADNIKNSKSQPYAMLREKLNAAGVSTASISESITVKSVVLANPRASSPDRIFTGAKFTLSVPGKGDVTLTFGPVSITGSSARYPFLNPLLGAGSKFSMLALRDNDKDWTLASVRYGHGAGLSQIGAYQMAVDGKTFKDILTFYYNLGSASKLVTMSWSNSDSSSSDSSGYTVQEVSKTGKVNAPGTTLNVRSGPGTGYSVTGSLKDGANVKITGQVSDWWRIDLGSGKNGFVSGSYIKLDAASQGNENTNTDKPAEKAAAVNTPGTTLNVRSGPGTTYQIIGSLSHGQKIKVTSENNAWYKFSFNNKTGYVSAAFIKLDNTATTDPANDTKTVVVNTPGSTLNVRDGAGTGHAIIGSLKHGEKVTVTDIQGDWYKLTYNSKTGYISKAFTKADGASSSAAKTMYVNTPGLTLNVRSGMGTTHSIIGSLKHGEKVSVTEGDSAWFKITFNGKTGYINKAFVVTDPVLAGSDTTPKSGVVNSKIGLNVRDGAGSNHKIIGGLVNGTKVTITEKNGSWYKIKYGAGYGWVSSGFIK